MRHRWKKVRERGAEGLQRNDYRWGRNDLVVVVDLDDDDDDDDGGGGGGGRAKNTIAKANNAIKRPSFPRPLKGNALPPNPSGKSIKWQRKSIQLQQRQRSPQSSAPPKRIKKTKDSKKKRNETKRKRANCLSTASRDRHRSRQTRALSAHHLANTRFPILPRVSFPTLAFAAVQMGLQRKPRRTTKRTRKPHTLQHRT